MRTSPSLRDCSARRRCFARSFSTRWAAMHRLLRTDDFERLYALHAESRVHRGLIPIGLFGEAERRRHLACLADWNESARRRDLIGRCSFQIYRFGRASEDERVDHIEGPIILDVPVPGTDAAGPRRASWSHRAHPGRVAGIDHACRSRQGHGKRFPCRLSRCGGLEPIAWPACP